ncbi:MAG: J domain-containing protein [Spirochaetes bacterium]|nr:J domain-containing protein [Spirochaetota bacterium]
MTQSLLDAVKLLEISERATLAEINQKYRALLFTWHPDRCREDPEQCRAMTEEIIRAYRTVMSYCYNYKFSFSKEDIEKNRQLNPEEFWHKRFGDDPLWGFPDKK